MAVEFKKSKQFTGVMYNQLKNNDRSYYITYKLNGKYTRLHIGKKSEGVNEAFCHKKRIETINNIKFGDDTPVVSTKKKVKPFHEIAELYFDYVSVHNKDFKNQVSRYEKHIRPYTDGLNIEEITPVLLEKIQSDKQRTHAPKTVNHFIQSVGTIFNHAINRNIINIVNPVKQVKKLKVSNERLRYLCREEIEELLEEVKDNEQLYLFTLLALNTGARLHTLVNIKKKDIRIEQKCVSLRDFKNNSFYYGFLQDNVVELLKKRIKNLRSNDFVLMYGTEKISNLDDYISRRLRPILDELFNRDLDVKDRQNRVVVHTLRHTFASHLAINGTPIFTIQKLMNHKDIKQTMRYAKLDPRNGQEFVNELYS
jgi:integrase